MTHLYLIPAKPGQPAHISQSGFALCGATLRGDHTAAADLAQCSLCKRCQFIAAQWGEEKEKRRAAGARAR